MQLLGHDAEAESFTPDTPFESMLFCQTDHTGDPLMLLWAPVSSRQTSCCEWSAGVQQDELASARETIKPFLCPLAGFPGSCFAGPSFCFTVSCSTGGTHTTRARSPSLTGRLIFLRLSEAEGGSAEPPSHGRWKVNTMTAR